MYEGHKWCALIRNERLGLLQVMREVLLKGCNLKAPSRPRNGQVAKALGQEVPAVCKNSEEAGAVRAGERGQGGWR